MGGSESSQTSTPVDLTPPEFTALRNPLAQALLALFSGNVPTFTGNMSGGLGASTSTMTNPQIAVLQAKLKALQDQLAKIKTATTPTPGPPPGSGNKR